MGKNIWSACFNRVLGNRCICKGYCSCENLFQLLGTCNIQVCHKEPNRNTRKKIQVFFLRLPQPRVHLSWFVINECFLNDLSHVRLKKLLPSAKPPTSLAQEWCARKTAVFYQGTNQVQHRARTYTWIPKVEQRNSSLLLNEDVHPNTLEFEDIKYSRLSLEDATQNLKNNRVLGRFFFSINSLALTICTIKWGKGKI